MDKIASLVLKHLHTQCINRVNFMISRYNSIMQLKISMIPSPLFLHYFPPWLDFHLLKKKITVTLLHALWENIKHIMLPFISPSQWTCLLYTMTLSHYRIHMFGTDFL